jgi:hypothetical protein
MLPPSKGGQAPHLLPPIRGVLLAEDEEALEAVLRGARRLGAHRLGLGVVPVAHPPEHLLEAVAAIA